MNSLIDHVDEEDKGVVSVPLWGVGILNLIFTRSFTNPGNERRVSVPLWGVGILNPMAGTYWYDAF